MNAQSIQLINFSNTTLNALVQGTLDVKGVPTQVIALGNVHAMAQEGVNIPLLLSNRPDVDIESWPAQSDLQFSSEHIRYYVSPIIAQTAFDDLELKRDHTPVFEGRSQAEMLGYLIKNAK